MIKVATPLIVMIVVLTSFSPTQKVGPNKVSYAFVTDTERDKAYDEPENNGYVDITSNIVSFDCSIGPNGIELQFIQHYAAEEKTQNRDRAFSLTRAWIYDSYDKAVASRRDWMAKTQSKHTRRIERFYVTCN